MTLVNSEETATKIMNFCCLNLYKEKNLVQNQFLRVLFNELCIIWIMRHVLFKVYLSSKN